MDRETLIQDVYEAFKQDAEAEQTRTGRTLVSCLMTLLRPHFVEAIAPRGEGTMKNEDGREKQWTVETSFWDVTNGMNKADLVQECEEETVRGMGGVQTLLEDYVVLAHPKRVKEPADIPEFSATSLKRRLGGLRPSICRGEGEGTLRIYYSLGCTSRFLCQCLVSRFEK